MAAAKHIGGENYISKVCDSASALHNVLAQSQSLVKDEHSGPLFSGSFVISQISKKFDSAFAVTNVLRLQRMLPLVTIQHPGMRIVLTRLPIRNCGQAHNSR
jgi:hypothetical protein